MIAISVQDHDAALATELANAYVDELGSVHGQGFYLGGAP